MVSRNLQYFAFLDDFGHPESRNLEYCVYFTPVSWFFSSIVEQTKMSETLQTGDPCPGEFLLAEWQRGNKRKQQNGCLATDIETTCFRTGKGCQRPNSQ